MTVIARFEVIPVREGSMSTAIAAALQALDQHPVSYETTATDTIIEADSAEAVFAAVQAAHRAIPDDRVITSVEIDEDRRRSQDMHQRVASVERELGHPPQRSQQPTAQGAPTPPPQGTTQSMEVQSPGHPSGSSQSSTPMASGQGVQPSQSQQGQMQGSSQPDRRPPAGQAIQGGSLGPATGNPPTRPSPGPHR